MINTHILTMQRSAKYLARTQTELMTSVFVKSVADSFVSVYVPIYLLTHGLSLQQVMAYCVAVFASTYLALLLSLKSCQYVGVKKTMTLGIVMTAVFYWLLHALVPVQTYLATAIIDGISLGLYFGAYNMLLTRAMHRSKEGKSYVLLQIAGMAAGILGPFIGSLFIRNLSFEALFMVVIVLMAVAPVPLFFSKDYKVKREPLRFAQMFRGSSSMRRVDRSVFLQGILYGAGTIWPLYLYQHYPHIVALGALTSLNAALILLMTYAAGRVVDGKQRFAYAFGAIVYAPTWITRLLFVTPIGLAANAFAASLLGVIPTMAVAKDIFHSAKTSSNRSAHFNRVEFYMDLGRVSIFVVAYLITNLHVMFVVSGLAAVGYMFCRPKATRRTAEPALQQSR